MTLIYLDTETTGLDVDVDEVWEIAYAIEGGPIHSHLVSHLVTPEPFVADLNGYNERTADRGLFIGSGTFETVVQTYLGNATLVGANPAFDAEFLKRRWGSAPWHYRMLDIESYAMPAMGTTSPKGLTTVTEFLLARGHDIPTPDHSAAGDVATLRACHLALREIYAPFAALV